MGISASLIPMVCLQNLQTDKSNFDIDSQYHNDSFKTISRMILFEVHLVEFIEMSLRCPWLSFVVLGTSAGSLNLEELTNVIPLHLLLTYLVHQIEVPQIPNLPDFLRRSKSEYLESEAVPLWEEKPKAMENLKANVMRLADAWLFLQEVCS